MTTKALKGLCARRGCRNDVQYEVGIKRFCSHECVKNSLSALDYERVIVRNVMKETLKRPRNAEVAEVAEDDKSAAAPAPKVFDIGPIVRKYQALVRGGSMSLLDARAMVLAEVQENVLNVEFLPNGFGAPAPKAR